MPVKKNYIKLLIILLTFGSKQSIANWKKTAIDSTTLAKAVLAGYYVHNKHNNPMVNQSFNPAVNVQSLSYNPVYSQLRTSAHLKNKKDQCGVAGLYTATKEILEEFAIQDQYESHDVLIEGLLWSELISDEQRIVYLKKALKLSVDENFNYELAVRCLSKISHEEWDSFLKKLHEFAYQDTSKIITMNNFYQAIIYNGFNFRNQVEMYQLLGVNNQQLIDMILKIHEWLITLRDVIDTHIFNSNKKLEYAWHESSHAFEAVCANKNLILSQVSIKGSGLIGGACFFNTQFEQRRSTSLQDEFYDHAERLDFMKRRIRIFLAGGIGQMILENKKLSYAEFQERYECNISSDMRGVSKELMHYLLCKDFIMIPECSKSKLKSRVIKIPGERLEYIEKLVEECYEEAYLNLYANKDIVDKIAQEVLKHGVISGDIVYQLAGKERAKYDFEMSSTEIVTRSLLDWLSWTCHCMAFYDQYDTQI